jgi:HEXXH motif-containing protein
VVDVSTSFEPSAQRARILDQYMRDRLAASLRTVASYLEERVAGSAAPLEAFLPRLLAAPVEALSFSAYFELVLAIEAEADDEWPGLIEVIAAGATRPPEIQIVAIDDPAVPRDWDSYRRMVATEPDVPMVLEPPPVLAVEQIRKRLELALEWLDRGAPALAAELRCLIGEVVLASVPPGDTFVFDGASSFMLWGAVLLNVSSHETRLDCLQALVHESAHNLLFGFSVDGPLTDNDPDARFDSPLRLDPRPMEGIFHAAFVTARMHHAVRELLCSGILGGADHDEARAALELHVKSFEQGRATIERHAQLTPVGRAVIDGAIHYMAQHARA